MQRSSRCIVIFTTTLLLLIFVKLVDNNAIIFTSGKQQVYYFGQCRNVSRPMIFKDDFEESIIRGDLNIPLQFGCKQVLFDSSLKLDPSSGKLSDLIFHGYNLPLSNICLNVRQWEVSLNLSCVDLLCEGNRSRQHQQSTNSSLGLLVSEMTQHNTTVQDWINYCQYCSNENMLFKQRVKSNTCQTNDDTIQPVIDNFPNSLQYCGFETFALPLLTLDNYFICACEGYFAYKCFTRLQSIDRPNLQVALIGIVTSCILIFILPLSYIPKVYYSLKRKKIFDIFPLTYSLLFTILLGVETSIMATILIEEVVFILRRGIHASLLLAVSAWISNWYRLIRKVSNSESLGANIIVYIFQSLIILTLIFIIPSVMIFFFPKESLIINGSISFLSLIAALLILGACVWVNKKLKLFSDVNIYESNFYKFIGFVVILLIIHSIVNLCMLVLMDKDAIMIGDALLLIINCGIIVQEFDSDLSKRFFSSIFSCLRRRSKSEKEYESLDSSNTATAATLYNPSSTNEYSTSYN